MLRNQNLIIFQVINSIDSLWQYKRKLCHISDIKFKCKLEGPVHVHSPEVQVKPSFPPVKCDHLQNIRLHKAVSVHYI